MLCADKALDNVANSPLVAASDARTLTESILASRTALTDTSCAETADTATQRTEVIRASSTALTETNWPETTLAALFPEIRASPET